jgi:hypothetical protein
VSPDLPHDCRDRESTEVDAAVGVEAVGRFDQSDRTDLDEILDTLPPIGVPPRERDDEREVFFDQTVTSRPLLPHCVRPGRKHAHQRQ